MNQKKVIILVAADGNYQDLVQAIRNTWGSSKLNGFEILYYYGYRQNYPRPEPGQCIQVNDELICGVKSYDVNNRNKIAFQYIYNNYDFEYLFRCCAGSYLNLKKMNEFLQNSPKINFYCGPVTLKIISKDETVPFAIGFGIFFSKDVVKLLIDNPLSFSYHHDEDVAFGRFLVKKGILPTKTPTQYRFENIQDLDENQFQYHIRNNVPLMYEIHQRIGLKN
jgi:hypothetical protein